MKYTTTPIGQSVTILANDHFVAIPYNCSELTSLAEEGVIKAGTVIPANDSTAVGVLFNDVVLAENPNGTVVIHGFIDTGKMGTAPTAEAITALKDIRFLANGAFYSAT